MTKPQALATLLVVVAIAVSADEAAVKKYRNYTPAQIAKLSEVQRSSEVPIMFNMAASRGLSKGSELLFGMELNRLMYPGLHDFQAAIKAFQVDLGDKPTGELTVWQIYQLQQRAEMQALSAILFPDRFWSHLSEAYATVEGTMIILDDKIAWPVNHVIVQCFKSSNQCEVTQIHLVIPDESSWSQTYHVMRSDTDYYSISRWTADSIESHPLGTSDDCRNTSLSLSFKTKEFYQITKNAGGDCKILGAEIPKLNKPRIAQIVDGSKLIDEEFASVQKKAFEVLSSAFRKKVATLDTEDQ